MMTIRSYSIALDWVNSDRQAICDDVERLGLRGAVRYNEDLIADRLPDWGGIGRRALLEAIADTHEEWEAEGLD
jgi:hypothetical protein